jgi:hypothetical protein
MHVVPTALDQVVIHQVDGAPRQEEEQQHADEVLERGEEARVAQAGQDRPDHEDDADADEPNGPRVLYEAPTYCEG